MTQRIAQIPADNNGNVLYIKDGFINGDKFTIKYKTTFNDIPFTETEIFEVDDNFVITGNDGTVLFRFSSYWLSKINIYEKIQEET